MVKNRENNNNKSVSEKYKESKECKNKNKKVNKSKNKSNNNKSRKKKKERDKNSTVKDKTYKVSLIETWVEEKDKEKVISKLSSELKWTCKPAERKERCTRGRASSGHLIGVKKICEKEWKIEEWNYGYVIKNDVMSEAIETVYNNVGIKKIEKEIKNVIKKHECEYENIIVIGDMNARIGECTVPGLSESRNKKTKSMDRVINTEGKKLLKLCDELGLKIINGATKGDKAGEVTFICGKNEDCCSVLDIALQLDRGDEEKIIEFRILKRIESDHLPIHIIIRINSMQESEKEKTRTDIRKGLTKLTEERIKWKKEKATEYAEQVHNKWRNKKEEKEEL